MLVICGWGCSSVCDSTIEAEAICAADTDEHRTLEAFWTVIDQQYAVFAERPVEDWRLVGERACAAVDDGADLFDVLIDLAERFDDGHIQLEGGGRSEDGWANEYRHYDAVDQLREVIDTNYVDEPLRRGANNEFAWGRTGSIGVLVIESFDGLGSGDEDSDVRAARRAMERALADLAGIDALIVDIRANGGGWDSAALEVASFVSGPRTLAWSEQRRDGPRHIDLGEWEDVFVEGRSDAFEGPVALLTSGGTFSAAETFALAMRVRPQVTLIGERTSGHFSDLGYACLPNGWELTLSNERYRAADGEVYEARGVPVDMNVALSTADIEEGRDVIFEAAVMFLSR